MKLLLWCKEVWLNLLVAVSVWHDVVGAVLHGTLAAVFLNTIGRHKILGHFYELL